MSTNNEKTIRMIEFVNELIDFFNNNIEDSKYHEDEQSARDWSIRKKVAQNILKGLMEIENS